MGPTKKLTVTGTAAAVQVAIPGDNNKEQYRIVNAGTTAAFLGFGETAAIALAAATVVSESGSALYVLPGAVEIISVTGDAFFAAVTESGSTTLYITPGEGL